MREQSGVREQYVNYITKGAINSDKYNIYCPVPDVYRYQLNTPRVAAEFQGKNVEVECAENMEL